MSQWYALACVSTPGYLGQQWEIYNAALRRPRVSIVDLQRAAKFPSLASAKDEARHGKAILGVEFRPVKIGIKDKGEDSRVILEATP